MIKFFRRIRRKLIDEGNLKRYAIYAIGEILLVVIGILIALQINNWNEARKDLVKSHEILLEIKENLQFNTSRFMAEIKEEMNVVNSIDIVLENINKYKEYNDTLDFHFLNTTYWPTSSKKSSGYETLKSQGVELIKSTVLRQTIINLYEKTYNDLLEIIRESRADHESSIVPLFTELFMIHPSIPNQPFEELGATPFNYDEVVHSQKFRGVLGYWRNTRTVAIQMRQIAIEKNNELIGAINNELDNT